MSFCFFFGFDVFVQGYVFLVCCIVYFVSVCCDAVMLVKSDWIDLINILSKISNEDDYVMKSRDLETRFNKLCMYTIVNDEYTTQEREKISIYLTFYGNLVASIDSCANSRAFAVVIFEKALEHYDMNYCACVDIADVYNDIAKWDIPSSELETKHGYWKKAKRYLRKFTTIMAIMTEKENVVDFSKKYNSNKRMDVIASLECYVQLIPTIQQNMKKHQVIDTAINRCCVL